MGDLTLSSNGTEITGLWFTGQKYLSVPFPENYEEKDLPVFVQAVHWLDDYFGGRESEFMPPLLPEGTSFRKKGRELLHDSLSPCGGANGSLTGYAAAIDRK